jgi:hypothetical protein
VIRNGIVAYVTFNIKNTAFDGTIPLQCNPSASDPFGIEVPISGADGSVEVKSEGTSTSEGTFGSKITIIGKEFGVKKGKVIVGKKAKVERWSDNAIEVMVKVKKPAYPVEVTVKGGDIVTMDDTFTLMLPEIFSVTIDETSRMATIEGKYFSKKKGKIKIGGKKCRIKKKNWTMEPETETEHCNMQDT